LIKLLKYQALPQMNGSWYFWQSLSGRIMDKQQLALGAIIFIAIISLIMIFPLAFQIAHPGILPLQASMLTLKRTTRASQRLTARAATLLIP
jgi:hypothetical protein